MENYIKEVIPKVFQFFLNIVLVLLAVILSFLLIKELISFLPLLFNYSHQNYIVFFENILIFFLYFEFITMIVKYFEEDYHFPLRYFIYIGITAMIRLIIVVIILTLYIRYFIRLSYYY